MVENPFFEGYRWGNNPRTTRDLEGGNRFEVVDPTFETTPEGDATRNTLTVKDLGRDYFGSTFTCLASNNNVTEPVNTNVTIDMRREL